MAGGQSITSGQGSVTAIVPGTAVTGEAASTEAGTAVGSRILPLRSRKVGSGASSRALSGLSISPASGLTAAVPQLAPVGQAVSGAVGAFGKSRSITQTGSAVSVGQGTVIAPSAVGPLASDFTVTSSVGGTNVPFSLGYAFRQGDVPAGQIATTADASSWQCVVKNAWPDGSAKFAILSGRKTLTAGVAATVTLSAGSATGGTALTTADLKTAMAGQTCSIACGAFGTVSWATTDFDTPFQTWVSGPVMSSWVYRKQVGSDAHLVGWIEVRLFAGGAVEVLPWIENGYIRVTGPTSKSATYTFTLGSTQRFNAAIDLPHHCRTPLLSGSALSHWLASDPGATFRHNSAYLQSTKLVPSYRATVSAGATVVTALPTTFTPLAQGSWTYPSDSMPGTGYSPPIGLLPQHDVLYLTTSGADSTVYSGVVRAGYSAGRYPIHYRDENTNRPLRFSQFPNLSANASTTNDLLPTTSGTAPPGWDVPHHPSVGFMAYLVTGRWYFMEETLFAATTNYLYQVDSAPQRNFSQGIFNSQAGASTVRGAAWANRTLAQAATVVPDAETTLRSEFVASLTSNITFNYNLYVGQTNNPYGFVAPYGVDTYGTPTDGKVTEASWQQDFYTAAFGYMLSLDPPITGTTKGKLVAFFSWKAKSAVGRLGGTASTDWLYRDAAPFNMVIALVDTPDFTTGTGPWPTSWGAMYQATLGVPNPGVTGDIRGGNFPDPTSYWGNLIPAISYAVEHGVVGAVPAYNRMVNAANWSTLANGFNTDPVWGVKPADLPSWVTAQPLFTWFDIPSTALSATPPSIDVFGDPATKISAWCGATLKRNGSVYMLGAAGGHQDYAGNEVNQLKLNCATPRWVERAPPTPDALLYNDSQYYADLRPSATHTYQATQFHDGLNTMFVLPSPGMLATGSLPEAPGGFAYKSTVRVFAFSDTVGNWITPDTVGFWDTYSGGGDFTARMVVKHQDTGDVYMGGGFNVWRFRPTAAAGSQWTQLSTQGLNGQYVTSAMDPIRNRWINVGSFEETRVPQFYNLSGTNITGTLTLTGLGESALGRERYQGSCYDEANDCFYIFRNTNPISAHKITADALAVSVLSMSNAPAQRLNGIHNAVQYVPELRGIVLVNSYTGNVKFMRTAN